jgi:hypothetical protein
MSVVFAPLGRGKFPLTKRKKREEERKKAPNADDACGG